SLQELDVPVAVTRVQQKGRVQARNRVLSLIPAVVFGVILLLVWYAFTASGRINSLILPSPVDVVSNLLEGIGSGVMFSNAWVTIQESLLGFVFGLIVALPMGYGIAKSRFVAVTVQPYLAAGQAIPAVVIAPFLFLWLGMGIFPVTVICMLVVLFPMVINTVLGVQTIDREVLDAARLDGASGWSMLAHMEFPLALPAILAAVRTGITLSIVGAVVGEFFCNPDQGLGSLIMIALHQYNTAFMFATVVVLAILAALYYGATWGLVKLANRMY
ncbi:MAG TPA: ABC transporter permease, partial [Dictyobacter sp.]|nr:ABC transporter permease [Dictyobacter sp.]